MDALRFLKSEHEAARAGLARLEQASGHARSAVWRELRPELEMHEQIEEACLYGPLAEDAEHRDASLGELRQRHAQDVAAAERLVQEVDATHPDDDHQWMACVGRLRSALERHIEMEEHEIFPRIGLVCNRDRLERAGNDLERMKRARSGLAA